MTEILSEGPPHYPALMPSAKKSRSRRVCVDTGGTFTDLIEISEGRVRVQKLLSTPGSPEKAVLEALEGVGGPGAGGRLVHGNTVGLNALLQGRGAKVALVTNAGFEDLIEIARQDRPELYARAVLPRETLVPRRLRFGIAERRLADGTLESKASKAELAKLVDRIRKSGAEALAICLLHSYAHPEDEERIAGALRKTGLPMSLSSRLLRRHREYERYSTTLINAFVGPLVSQYLERLEEGAAPMDLHLVRNEGGTLPARDAFAEPARILLSGPAGGAAGVRYWSQRLGFDKGIGFDMGGTSADIALCGDEIDVEDQAALGSHSLALPSIPLASVGTGGGSLAWKDAGGALRVGPIAAGAHPGPACYGKGELPTVTDAHLFLGRLPDWGLLGGDFPLYPTRALAALEKLGEDLDLPTAELCKGILEIADLQMARPLRQYTLGRGIDPKALPLVAFGGAGGLHACRLARLCGFETIIVPPHQGLLSAEGMFLADEIFERERAFLSEMDSAGERALVREARDLLAQVRAELREKRSRLPRHEAKVFTSLRYRGMNAEFWVPANKQARERFLSEFESRFGFAQDLPVESLRLRARLRLASPTLPDLSEALLASAHQEPSLRQSRLSEKGLPCLTRSTLPREPAHAQEGPLAILDYAGTTIVESGFRVHLHDSGALLLQTCP